MVKRATIMLAARAITRNALITTALTIQVEPNSRDSLEIALVSSNKKPHPNRKKWIFFQSLSIANPMVFLMVFFMQIHTTSSDRSVQIGMVRLGRYTNGQASVVTGTLAALA